MSETRLAPDVVGEERASRLVLDARQVAAETDRHRFPNLPPVLDVDGDSVLAKQPLQFKSASPWKTDVLWEILRAGDHPGRRGGGEPHALLLVELRVLKSGRLIWFSS
jgi:hypothetical protein